MKSILFVGDTHAVVEDLDDCRALMGLVREVAANEKVDEICFLGDQYNSFMVTRVEVMAFWRETFKSMPAPVRGLVGNHDKSPGSTVHAMLAHADQISVVDKPVLDNGILYMPYYDNNDEFLADAKAGGGKTLVCHATFDGSMYDNKFYAPDGIDYKALPQDTIIVGHIHSAQSFGNVTYIGAPRWRTLSDANLQRAIWVYLFDDDGRVLAAKPFDTGQVCRQIRYVEDTPDSPFDEATIDPKHDWRIDVRGPAAFVEERKTKLTGPGVRVRTFKTELSAPKLRESEGIDKAFHSYLGKFTPRFGTAPDILASLAKERLAI